MARLPSAVLILFLLLSLAACSPASTPIPAIPIPDKPTLTDREVIANVQMKGLPMLKRDYSHQIISILG